MDNKRPTGRKRRVTGKADAIHRREENLGTGQIHNVRPDNFGDKTENIGVTGKTGSGKGIKRGGGALSLVAIAALLLFGGNNLLGGGSGSTGSTATPVPTAYVAQATPTPKPTATPKPQASSSGSTNYGISPSNYNNLNAGSTTTTITHTDTATVNNSVASAAREKRTVIRGNGNDQVTIMIYMCGTDLESKSSMATRDLVEMTNSSFNDNVRIVVYTGGCSRWNNSIVASDRNQIYEVKKGGLKKLEANMGTGAMTDPDTLSTFIQWCAKNYPANRNELILWDHGGGSVTGYGYDEKNSRAGSMTLAGINEALKAGGVTFDFVGFDACLMATLETGLMLDSHADYLIASEETEPGIGWYYTNWLSKLAANPSMPTVEIGKNIVDDFVSTCAAQTRGQSATLSVVDLAELAATVPGPLKDFSLSLTERIKNNQYQEVSTARNGTREFARSTLIDQIDLTHFAKRFGSGEGQELASALQKAVKYNRTSSDMSDCYGISIYFPYRKANKVDAACNTYDAIGMDESYSDCIRAFASLEVSGQAASGMSGYGIPSILTGGYSSSSAGDYDMISQLLGAFLTGGYGNTGYSSANTGFFTGRALSEEDTAQYIADNSFDPTALVWTENSDGDSVISLPEEQWALVNGLEYNLFYDDGKGYINLGLDVVFDFDDEGNLLAPDGAYWICINNKPVAFYHEQTVGEGEETVVSGYVPAILNGEFVDVLLRWYGTTKSWEIAGLRASYSDDETETVAKGVPALTDDVAFDDSDWVQAEKQDFWKAGDKLEFYAEYYTYAGVFEGTHVIGETTVSEDMEISDLELAEGNYRHSYRFTDLYQQSYWTPAYIQTND